MAHLQNVVLDRQAAFEQQVRQRSRELAEDGLSALGALYDLTVQRLVRYASMLTKHQQDAEDAVHTALVRMANAPRRLATADEPWRYLLRVVRNEALLIGRKKRPQIRGDLSDLKSYCRVDELEREESYRAIWRALRKLPHVQAEIVALKIWESLTFAQIAEVMQLSPNTVASRYRYGMEKLARMLQPLHHDGSLRSVRID